MTDFHLDMGCALRDYFSKVPMYLLFQHET